jgi:hypothetical protein
VADESTCPDGVPWCTRHLGGTATLHQSGFENLPLRQRGAEYGDAAACAVQLAEYPDSRVTVSVRAGGSFWPDGTRAGSAFLDVQNPEYAETIARFLEWMAMATPAQHRKLAAQVRAASAVAFGSVTVKDGDSGW